MNNTFILKLRSISNWQFLLLAVLILQLTATQAEGISYESMAVAKTSKSKAAKRNLNIFPPAENDEVDCEDAQNWMKTINLIVFENLTRVSDVDYNTFVGGDLVNINQSGNQLSSSQFSSYSKRSLEVVGKVKSGNDINIFYSGAFSNSNTIVKQNASQYTVNGRRFNANHASQGATLTTDNTLASTLSQIKSDLENWSEELSESSANNTLSFGNNGTEARFNVNSKDANGVAIFNVSDSEVFENSKIAQIVVNNTANASTILINVSGKSVTWQTGNLVGNWLTGTDGRSKTLWNFYEATSISFSRDLMGSLLAPKAVLQTSVDINGSVAVKSLNSTASVRKPYFGGNLCVVAEPLPASAQLAATVMLQGPYENGSMTTTLNSLGLIPKTDPYTGKTTVASIPAGVTDWINIEVRSNSAPNYAVIAEIPAFVKSNGTVVDKNGNTPVDLGVALGTYRIAIRHRNHLGIMTSKGIDFTSGSASSYNFTTSQSQAYQDATIDNTAMVSLGNGKFGMWGGNANNTDEYIYDANDPAGDVLSILSNVLSGNPNNFQVDVYLTEDVNMDGMIYDANDPLGDVLWTLLNALNGNPNHYLTQHLPAGGGNNSRVTNNSSSLSPSPNQPVQAIQYAKVASQIERLSLYPNPVSTSQLTVEINTDRAINQSNVLIYNSLGSIVKTQRVDIQKGNNRLLLDASDLTTGNYYIRIQSNDYISEPLPFVRVAR